MKESKTFVTSGMPPLDLSGRQTSFFEFWPMWLMYVPVIFQWLILSIRYRSLTLPLIANPKLPLSGIVGVGKSELMQQATGECAETILSWHKHQIGESSVDTQAARLVDILADSSINLPFVAKPDMGCRGSGVKLIRNIEQLSAYLEAYPVGTAIVLQKLSTWEPEAGVFFVREPGQEHGKVVSLALKYSPYVVGDGKSSLRELIERDPRAGELQHLYMTRHRENLEEIIEDGVPYRLVFSISHCRGAIFRNGCDLISDALTVRISELMSGLPEFHYGRLDIKFSNAEQLQRGKDIEIVEINAASAESLHIWDRDARLGSAFSALLWQYRTLFKLGSMNRRRGYVAPGVSSVLAHWKSERELARYYPLTD